jgi:hypothetical protein
MAESAVVPLLRAAGEGGWPIVGAPWAYHETAVVDWEID